MRLCQVRAAACTWLTALVLPQLLRQGMIQRTAQSIRETQRHNAAATRYHAKARRRKLRALGIRVERLQSCIPP